MILHICNNLMEYSLIDTGGITMQLSLLERLKTRTDLKPALYGRVSTDDQARHGFSIPSQVKMGKELEFNRGLEYLEEIKVFIDDGISGTHENRKDYIELKRLIKNREINLVIITDTDRIGRDTSINTSFAKLLISMGAELFVITDPALDIYTPSGMMQFSMKSVINTYEVHNTRQRAVRGIIQSFEQGNYANPGCPFGYKKINKKLYVNDAEAKVVLLIHELYVEDSMSILKVVEYLRINGYLNRTLKWSVHSVRRILENTVYVGYVYRKDLGRTFYKVSPPIISIELKDKAIKLLRTRKRNSKKSSKHLYYQKVRCVDCDNLCINDTSSKGYRYYLCSKCLKRYSEVKLDDELACEITTEILARTNKSLSDEAKKEFKKIQEREKIIQELYEEEQISRNAYRIEKKLISQSRRLYLQELASKSNLPIDWFRLSIVQKKKHIKKVVIEVSVNMRKKYVIKTTYK